MKSKIKLNLEKYVGKQMHFVFNGSRNQRECFYGTIEKMYDSVFIVKVYNSNDIKSFSYVDILTNTLILSNA